MAAVSDGTEGCDRPSVGHREPGVPRIPGKEEDENGGCHTRRRRAAPEKGKRHMKGPVPLTPTVPRRSPHLAEQRQRLLSSGPIKRWVALEGGPDKYKGIRQVKGVSGGAKGRRMLRESRQRGHNEAPRAGRGRRGRGGWELDRGNRIVAFFGGESRESPCQRSWRGLPQAPARGG